MGSSAAADSLSTHGDEFWLFGYGRIPGWVNGYVRRFWQVSYDVYKHSIFLAWRQDHRGTPQAPGRVVTLIERSYWASLTDHHDSAPDRVWGVAYRIRADKVAEVKDYLDIREINGYTIHFAPFHPAEEAEAEAASPGSPPIRTLVYIGTPDNDQFVGPQDPQALAAHIRHSVGPSGLNTEYLFNLHEALESLSPESGDEHIRDLTARVRAIVAAEGTEEGEDVSTDVVGTKFRRDSSTREQEETEK